MRAGLAGTQNGDCLGAICRSGCAPAAVGGRVAVVYGRDAAIAHGLSLFR